MKEVESIKLAFQKDSSDKFYNIAINTESEGLVGAEGQFTVDFTFGRTGTEGQTGTKTKEPVSLTEAKKIYDYTVASKVKKGYQEV
jgi:predicted DNA-binding WGR domain protein